MASFDIIAIGGSAGSIPIVSELLEALPGTFQYAVIIVLHRLKNVYSEMNRVLATPHKGTYIREPDDKDLIQPNSVYLAPQNYHLLIEADRSFSLDYSELVNYSRPSIDVTFESVAGVYGSRALAVLLSGANDDGAAGMEAILASGGQGIVQDPATAAYSAMPRAAAERNPKALVLPPNGIIKFLSTNT